MSYSGLHGGKIIGELYLRFLVIVLIGYAFFDKSFAYIGYFPIYIGEAILLCSVVALLAVGGSRSILRSPIIWTIITFGLWGLLNTVPHIGDYGINALRDGVVWGYAILAVTLSNVLFRMRAIGRTLHWYRKWMPVFVVWVPIAFCISIFFVEKLPTMPGAQFSILHVKPSDLAVHLAGAVGFLMLGLDRRLIKQRKSALRIGNWICWGSVVVGALLIAAQTRGGALSILFALVLVLIFRPNVSILKPLLAGIAILFVAILVDIELPLGRGRDLSLQQIFQNMASIFVGTERPELYGTVDWRLQWWQTIVNYTILGEHYWTGKGYGINLADSDGFQVVVDGSPLRSPHSSHFTILARSGVPGLFLWMVLQLSILIEILRAYFRNRRDGHLISADICIWLLAYWSAMSINMSFDVYLEGPQGGIWYWCLVAFIIAFMQMEKRKRIGKLKSRDAQFVN